MCDCIKNQVYNNKKTTIIYIEYHSFDYILYTFLIKKITEASFFFTKVESCVYLPHPDDVRVPGVRVLVPRQLPDRILRPARRRRV